MSQLAKFDFCITPNQQLDATIKLPKEDRGVIHGQVIDECNKPIEDAVVKLFELDCKWDGKKPGCQKMQPITHTFTDECGQFLFGPLCANKFYFVKIWVNDVCVTQDHVEFKRDCSCIHPRPCCEECCNPSECKCEERCKPECKCDDNKRMDNKRM